MKQRSDKAEKLGDVRRDLLQKWFVESEDPLLGFVVCEIQFDRLCGGRATEGHEPRLRSRGGSIIERKNVLLTCHHCHMAVHRSTGDDLQRAYAMGYLVHSWA